MAPNRSDRRIFCLLIRLAIKQFMNKLKRKLAVWNQIMFISNPVTVAEQVGTIGSKLRLIQRERGQSGMAKTVRTNLEPKSLPGTELYNVPNFIG
jgi:hypothetical protein